MVAGEAETDAVSASFDSKCHVTALISGLLQSLPTPVTVLYYSTKLLGILGFLPGFLSFETAAVAFQLHSSESWYRERFRSAREHRGES